MTTPTPTQRHTIALIVNTVVTTIRETGDHGAPGGVIYSALIAQGCTKSQFDSLMAALVRKGQLRYEPETFLYFALPTPLPGLVAQAIELIRAGQELLPATAFTWNSATTDERRAVHDWIVKNNHSLLHMQGTEASERRFRMLVDLTLVRGCYGCGRAMLSEPIDAQHCSRCRPTT